MSKSTDSGHFFQTSASIAESDRKAKKSSNTHGDPIRVPSKVLAAASDPEHARQIFVAEAAGTVRRISLESENGGTIALYTGPKAPLTCVAVSRTPATDPRLLVFAGCWDNAIWSWDISSRQQHRTYLGHGDFVKAVLPIKLGDSRALLVSGGADATIIVWDVISGDKLHVVRGGHSRGILALALDPLSIEPGDYAGEGGLPAAPAAVTVFSADSSRDIRTWQLTAATWEERPANSSLHPLIAHETSVNGLCFDADGDLWTASSDRTAKCLARERGWAADTELVHPDFVRDVVVDEEGGWVVTACRDEEVRVWERSSGKLYHTFTGHFEEVTGLVLLPGQRLVSISIDATIRQWSLKAADLQRAKEAAEKEREPAEEEEQGLTRRNLLTEEEEQELAELMDDSD